MMARVEHIGDATLYLGDARAIVPDIAAPAAVVTSPPYGQQRDYGLMIADWRALVSGALSGIPDIGDTQILVNLGMIHRDGEVVPYWEPFIGDMRAALWRFFGWYIWDQGPGLPGDWAGRLAPAHEFIFHFNRTSRKPNKIVPCTHGGKSRGTKSGLRGVDGVIGGWSAADLITQEYRIGDSVVRAMRHKHVGGIEAGHPAVFPIALPRDLVASYTDVADTILDPFMGSGTTGVACIQLGRKFIGIEIEPKYFDIACKRIEQELRQGRLQIEPQPKRQPALGDLLNTDATQENSIRGGR